MYATERASSAGEIDCTESSSPPIPRVSLIEGIRDPE